MYCDNEAWGLSASKGEDVYVTCSNDGTLRLWDLNSHEKLKVIKLDVDENGERFTELESESSKFRNPKKRSMSAVAVVSKRLFKDKNVNSNDKSLTSQGRACDISHDGELIAVGMADGSLRVY